MGIYEVTERNQIQQGAELKRLSYESDRSRSGRSELNLLIAFVVIISSLYFFGVIKSFAIQFQVSYVKRKHSKSNSIENSFNVASHIHSLSLLLFLHLILSFTQKYIKRNDDT